MGVGHPAGSPLDSGLAAWEPPGQCGGTQWAGPASCCARGGGSGPLAGDGSREGRLGRRGRGTTWAWEPGGGTEDPVSGAAGAGGVEQGLGVTGVLRAAPGEAGQEAAPVWGCWGSCPGERGPGGFWTSPWPGAESWDRAPAPAHPAPRLSASGPQRRRLIPAPMPDTAALGRKPGLPGQWVDLPPPLAGSLKEPFEIKVYEIDDVERLQRHRPPPREDPAEVRAGGAWGRGPVRRGPGMAGRAPWGSAQQPAELAFPSCPQPSQDVEKVGTSSPSPEARGATDAHPG